MTLFKGTSSLNIVCVCGLWQTLIWGATEELRFLGFGFACTDRAWEPVLWFMSGSYCLLLSLFMSFSGIVCFSWTSFFLLSSSVVFSFLDFPFSSWLCVFWSLCLALWDLVPAGLVSLTKKLILILTLWHAEISLWWNLMPRKLVLPSA